MPWSLPSTTRRASITRLPGRPACSWSTSPASSWPTDRPACSTTTRSLTPRSDWRFAKGSHGRWLAGSWSPTSGLAWPTWSSPTRSCATRSRLVSGSGCRAERRDGPADVGRASHTGAGWHEAGSNVEELVRTVGRLLSALLVLLIVVIVATGGLLVWVSHRALPTTSGSLRAAGLAAPVSVTRDISGLINISATTPHDLFLAQGYVHAQERFWQMEVWRHIGACRLSELFGQTTLKEDEFIRTLGWRQAAQRDLDAASPELKADLQAYADGVNDWLAANRGQLGLAFVVEGFKAGLGGGLGGYDPEPWTPLDSATWALVQAWSLGDNFDSEIFRVLADAKLGNPKRTDELTPAYPATGPVIVPSGEPGSGGAGANLHAGTAAASGTTSAIAATTRSTSLSACLLY